MNKHQIEDILENNPSMKEDLFIRGFLITENKNINFLKFPFYNNWSQFSFEGYLFSWHKKTNFHYFQQDKQFFFLFGHAYNPLKLVSSEREILRMISLCQNSKELASFINELTGIFVMGCVTEGKLKLIVDPTGLQSACVGRINNCLYVSSHAQLIADILGLCMDPFIVELINYKWYMRVKGPYLPADLTPFKELKRVIPNCYYEYNSEIKHKRFWPLTELSEVNNTEYDRIINLATTILENSFQMVMDKWEKPSISLTGGIDSNTTFAAANKYYSDINTFSYFSSEKEYPDMLAANKIAGYFNVQHSEFTIPKHNEQIPLFEQRRELFRHNNGYIAELYDHEIRKKLYLRDVNACDIEIKSWVSETTRAYWYKHFNRNKFPKLSAKLYRNLYKLFFFNRRLAKKIDKIYDFYLIDYEYDKIPKCYQSTDINYWEICMGSWGSLNIAEMRYCFDISVIYNNRQFLEMMLQIPLKKRIIDQHHLDMKRVLNKQLYDLNIRVVNLEETKKRAFLLNLVFTINNILPF